ncbi:polysaccharide deacetylase family protein [Nonomuraea roseoviolacea subsp. roseoviolacea]|uniref:Peptidoglycan/xylan/chitin deacetylase (PgdA/CDA1 family) n=1 Tax=Nonomuraea roseoviolacea subsp. carminata TaxID=160689 RepID=A0ABT1JSA1_9ACTN|nr:polysaccharide deacetylase family protein [Nonomuraea roseoviolacea]MCP2344166.1 peptidoglycan/xylan/chitin deacetylase (PgdA/CDA1 family) [Nonomuraea roseoviolacea subsp. carminata]
MRSASSLPPVVGPLIGVANVVVVAVAIVGLTVVPSHGERVPRPQAALAAPPTAKPPHDPTPPQGSPSPGPSASPAGQPPGVAATPEFARQVKANEAGVVPVLMYHRIISKRYASIDRTPKQLRQELESLAKRGYVPITAAEFVAGDIRVPAGKFPVVLTFDDGHPSHFRLDASGNPAPDTAAGVILDVARRYPSFRPTATFWVNREPFGLRDEASQAAAVRWLVGHGFEVANHTWSHPNLGVLPKKTVQKQIVKVQRMLEKLGAGTPRTLALPFGVAPHPRELARKGKWDGTRYDFTGVFLAGAEPSLSPYAKKFRPGAIQRIQSNGKKGECRKWCSQYWLEWLDKHPDDRYVSDGDPGRISVPTRLQGNIDAKWRGRIIAY